MLTHHMEQDEKRFDNIDERFNALDHKLDVLIEAHNKQKGFIAGFSAAFSLLASMVVALAVYIWQNFRA